MSRISLLPEMDSRALFIGMTGAGKTWAQLKLLEPHYGKRQIEILDTKGDNLIAQIDAPVVDKLEDAPLYTFPEYPLVIYRPSGEELADPGVLDDWCQWVYDRKNTTAWIDELSQLGNSTRPKMGFLNMLTRGRSRGVTVYMGSQRPVGIPKIAYTESQYIYKFYLADVKDRQRVAEYTHPSMVHQTKDKHGFHYFRVGDRKVYYVKSL